MNNDVIIDNIYTPKKITVNQILNAYNKKVSPINGLNIPNIVVPSHLANKKRVTETTETVFTKIRTRFNIVTKDNCAEVRQELRQVVTENVQTVETIQQIAYELLENFIIGAKQNIDNYMVLLNAVGQSCVLIPGSTKKTVSLTIGAYFLDKCKDKIYECVNPENVRKLALFDLDDDEEIDQYNREKEKIFNLITTICSLYKQRHICQMKVTAHHLKGLFIIMLTNHQKCRDTMVELGNPEEECKDEAEYEINRKMASLYAEQFYEFMSNRAADFNKDTDNNSAMPEIVSIFRRDVIPNMTEDFLKVKCESIVYDGNV